MSTIKIGWGDSVKNSYALKRINYSNNGGITVEDEQVVKFEEEKHKLLQAYVYWDERWFEVINIKFAEEQTIVKFVAEDGCEYMVLLEEADELKIVVK